MADGPTTLIHGEDIECVVKVVEHLDPSRPGGERLHDFRSALSLAQHVHDLHEAFGGTSALGVSPADAALWLPTLARFLTREEWDSGAVHRRHWLLEGSTLELRRAPHRVAAEAVRKLHAPLPSSSSMMSAASSSAAATLASACADVEVRLVDGQLAKAFFARGGVEALLELARRDDLAGVVQAALSTLQVAVCYPSGMERFLGAHGPVELVRRTHQPDDNPAACLSALRLLASVASREDGYARPPARAHPRAPSDAHCTRSTLSFHSALACCTLLLSRVRWRALTACVACRSFRIVHGAAIVASREHGLAAHAQLVWLVEHDASSDPASSAATSADAASAVASGGEGGGGGGGPSARGDGGAHPLRTASLLLLNQLIASTPPGGPRQSLLQLLHDRLSLHEVCPLEGRFCPRCHALLSMPLRHSSCHPAFCT